MPETILAYMIAVCTLNALSIYFKIIKENFANFGY